MMGKPRPLRLLLLVWAFVQPCFEVRYADVTSKAEEGSFKQQLANQCYRDHNACFGSIFVFGLMFDPAIYLSVHIFIHLFMFFFQNLFLYPSIQYSQSVFVMSSELWIIFHYFRGTFWLTAYSFTSPSVLQRSLANECLAIASYTSVRFIH